ncbi:hypothetical protein Taro_041441 [Colocasia esculenta]|uniref:Uncharacterized protein n=1 Tax=Colocasia esculenta TaxID=4460 RepID=A0A843WFV3_COLES|nr:hypothetical protein [Colocasia esculenta]
MPSKAFLFASLLVVVFSGLGMCGASQHLMDTPELKPELPPLPKPEQPPLPRSQSPQACIRYKSSENSLSLLLTTHGATAPSATDPTPSYCDDEPLAEGRRGVSLTNKAQ